MAGRRESLDGSAVAWTKKNRPQYDRRNQRYPSDLTADEWRELEPLLAVARGIGRPRTYSLEEVINGIRYVQRYGIPWDAMPKDLPPSSICYEYWRVLVDGGHLDRINHHLCRIRMEASRWSSAWCACILGWRPVWSTAGTRRGSSMRFS